MREETVQYSNGPEIILRDVFEGDASYGPWHENVSLAFARAVLQKSRERDTDSLRTLVELSRQEGFAGGGVTWAVGRLFLDQDQSLPSQWRKDQEISRSVLRMAVNIDLGYLRAQSIHSARGTEVQMSQREKRLESILRGLEERITPLPPEQKG